MQNLSWENEWYLLESKYHFHINGLALNLTLNRGLEQPRNGCLLWAFLSALAGGKRSPFLSSLSVSLSRVPVHGWITRISKLRERSPSRSLSPIVDDDPGYLTHPSSIYPCNCPGWKVWGMVVTKTLEKDPPCARHDVTYLMTDEEGTRTILLNIWYDRLLCVNIFWQKSLFTSSLIVVKACTSLAWSTSSLSYFSWA